MYLKSFKDDQISVKEKNRQNNQSKMARRATSILLTRLNEHPSTLVVIKHKCLQNHDENSLLYSLNPFNARTESLTQEKLPQTNSSYPDCSWRSSLKRNSLFALLSIANHLLSVKKGIFQIKKRYSPFKNVGV